MRNDQENTITVRWEKLVEGIGLVFAGATQLLSSMEPGMAQMLMEKTAGMVPGDNDADASAAGGAATAENTDEKATTETGTAESGNASGKAGSADTRTSEQASTASASAPSESASPAETPEAAEASAPGEKKTAPSVTQDDITKIIVRKIKQDRANSGKINAVLKSYGFDRVSDLPPEQYERFLTDISQL